MRTPHHKKCNCNICQRSMKLREIIRKLRDLHLEKNALFLESVADHLQETEFELQWITSGSSAEYLSTHEVMEEFGISANIMQNFLQERNKPTIAE